MKSLSFRPRKRRRLRPLRARSIKKELIDKDIVDQNIGIKEINNGTTAEESNCEADEVVYNDMIDENQMIIKTSKKESLKRDYDSSKNSDDEYNCSSDSDSSYKDDVSVLNVEELKLDAALCTSVGKILIDKGMVKHFNSLCGGKQKPVVLKYIVRRTSQLLVWTYFCHFLTHLNTDSVIQWYADLIENQYMCLERFVSIYLDDMRGLSASTCYNYLCDITKSFKWFIWYRHDRGNEYPVEGISAGGFADLLSQLRKNLKPAQQKQRVANTLRNMVANHRFPKGGIHELRQHLEDGIQWAISVAPATVISRKIDYNRFLSIIVNALYLFSPQGRIGGKNCLHLSLQISYAIYFKCYVLFFPL